MNHKYKTALFRCLDILPKKIGFFIYHRLQSNFTKETIESKIKSTEQSYNAVCRILEKNGVEIKNKHITEIGSGWLPIFPYFIKYYSEASVVNTYDINKHYNLKDILKLNYLFFENKKTTNRSFIGKYQLAKGINYFPNNDVCNADLTDTDLVISRFVLEHIPRKTIQEIHKVLFNKLKSGSHVLHLISPSDHRAYSDSNLSLFDFLQYNEIEWDKIQTKFDYHNRMRLPQYLKLLSKNFEIIDVEYDYCKKGTKQYDKFKALILDENFKKYNDEELTAGSINILLRVI